MGITTVTEVMGTTMQNLQDPCSASSPPGDRNSPNNLEALPHMYATFFLGSSSHQMLVFQDFDADRIGP